MEIFMESLSHLLLLFLVPGRYLVPTSTTVNLLASSFLAFVPIHSQPLTMPAPKNANETYCTFTLGSDVTAGGLPSEAEIAKDLESNDDNVKVCRR